MVGRYASSVEVGGSDIFGLRWGIIIGLGLWG